MYFIILRISVVSIFKFIFIFFSLRDAQSTLRSFYGLNDDSVGIYTVSQKEQFISRTIVSATFLLKIV